jgi:hypothetical protein
MKVRFGRQLLPSESGADADPQRREIVEFWNRLRVCEELGTNDWEVLESLERQVTECLVRDPPSYDEASSLTALAMLKIAGDL